MEVVWGGPAGSRLNQRLSRWASSRIWGRNKTETLPGPNVCMGVMAGADLIAVMVYHNYDPGAGVIEISGAATSKRWLTRPVLAEMFRYPFETAGCQLVVMRVSADKAQNRLGRMLLAYGFARVLIPRLRGRDEGEWIYTLTDDAWRSNKFNEVQ